MEKGLHVCLSFITRRSQLIHLALGSDYRGLKKKITAIKRVHEKDEAPSEDPMSEASTSHNPSVPHEGSRTSIQNQIPVNIVAEGSSGPQTQDRPLAKSKLSSIGSIRLGKARVQRSLKGVSRST